MKLKIPFRRGAFTLVEILVAVAIFGMIVAAIYSTWALILKSSRVGQNAAAQIQRERIALRTIEDSLTCVQSFQASMQYYSFIVQNGDQPMLSFAARLPAIFPRNGRFGDFNLRRLTFGLEPDKDGGRDLVLRQNPILMDMDPDEQGTPLVLARGVQDFVIECLATNGLETSWVSEWNDTNSIPTIVRVSLLFGGEGGPGGPPSPRSFTRIIATPSITLPSNLQVPGGPGGGGLQLPH